MILFSSKLGEQFEDVAADGRNAPTCDFEVVRGCPSRKGLGRDHVTTRQGEGGESVVGCTVNNVTQTPTCEKAD